MKAAVKKKVRPPSRGTGWATFTRLLDNYKFGHMVALAFGSDQDYQIDIINELDLANATYGITQVAGLHNISKAFLFRDVGRAVHAPAHITEKVVQLFRSKSEFTFLASIQQKSSTSGVIFSIHESEHSYFELESSGVREEIRYHYRFKGKPRSESFPYRLADGQWHKIALTISASHLLLHVDCNRLAVCRLIIAAVAVCQTRL
ncbi:Protein kinase C-binding protein NELL1 NEL-like protein 1 [Collichthys lucidus]|uniref:Protein kinase C-binding protein NELL1 NEL-like protein 1 n=1 Tax=Collichthys lucidus TaxID=240159 RepID=A0A4U5U5I8_COLLU|nr:Protein kinase C-binding protein NELL1 NEL-like protein 1 [Collichthys lucidus]